VPGLGPARRATLLRHFGSVRRIGGATAAEIASLPGIGPRLAEAVLAALAPGASPADAAGTGDGDGTGASAKGGGAGRSPVTSRMSEARGASGAGADGTGEGT
jgi:excinuclease ABC subunit C